MAGRFSPEKSATLHQVRHGAFCSREKDEATAKRMSDDGLLRKFRSYQEMGAVALSTRTRARVKMRAYAQEAVRRGLTLPKGEAHE